MADVVRSASGLPGPRSPGILQGSRARPRRFGSSPDPWGVRVSATGARCPYPALWADRVFVALKAIRCWVPWR